jgi:hypothetical protein
LSKKPITIYLSEGFDVETTNADWSFLYPRPTNLFLDLLKEKEATSNFNFFACPSFADITKRTMQYKSPMDASYFYDFTDKDNITINPLTENYIAFNRREKSLAVANNIFFELRWFMFADEPLEVLFTAPYFSESKYTRYASIIPGQFDVGQWFRPYNFEVQPWKPTGTIHIEKDEPLFYAQFQTDRKIEIKRFNMNKQLYLMSDACVKSLEIYGRGQSLFNRYKIFKNVGLKEKILTEIRKNLIDEEPYKF